MPRLLWCITVAVMAKKVKMKRMKVCPSVIRYLLGETGRVRGHLCPESHRFSPCCVFNKS